LTYQAAAKVERNGLCCVSVKAISFGLGLAAFQQATFFFGLRFAAFQQATFFFRLTFAVLEQAPEKIVACSIRAKVNPGKRALAPSEQRRIWEKWCLLRQSKGESGKKGACSVRVKVNLEKRVLAYLEIF
jgi:hypothetical protein